MKLSTVPFSLALIASLVMLACGQEPKNATDPAQPENPQTDVPAGMDVDKTTGEVRPAIDQDQMQEMMFNLLKGKWQHATTPGQSLEFADGKVRRIVGGNVVSEAPVTVDPTCQTGGCAKELGWCFIEKTAAGDQCNVVVRCDMRTLQFRKAGAPTSGDHVYNKVEN